MNNKKQSGFTLVEIAIVLVVIGLLLGGILKGQQLINSARVRNLADQNSGVQAAYYGFVDRFRNLPGDMAPAAACAAVGAAVDTACGGTPTIGGDGDGRIENVAEAGAVWAHLSVAGFITGTYSGDPANEAAYRDTSVAAGQIPPNAFQGPILLGHMDYYVDGALASQGTVTRLAYSFGGNIPVPLLRDLDQKLDDGIAGTGVLRSAMGAATAPTTGFDAIVGYTNSPECLADVSYIANWNVDSANPECNAIFLY